MLGRQRARRSLTAPSFTGDAHRQQLFTLLQCFLHLLKLDLQDIVGMTFSLTLLKNITIINAHQLSMCEFAVYSVTVI